VRDYDKNITEIKEEWSAVCAMIFLTFSNEISATKPRGPEICGSSMIAFFPLA
jgi:hypothetical protein